jgi:uncharacterized protein (TIGR03084 family)
MASPSAPASAEGDLMPPDLSLLLSDLEAETQGLVGLLSPLPASEWRRPTPAIGWSIADQVSHLAYFDEAATLAAVQPERFRLEAVELVARGPDFTNDLVETYRVLDPPELLAWFRRARTDYLDTFATLEAGTRLPWYGPPMSAASSVTARLMETWAHGLDIADTLGVVTAPTSRLRHIAHIGVRTFSFSFEVNHLEVPDVEVRVELTAPDGSSWNWGDPSAAERVVGSALDFCLVVTQRRNLDDTDLVATGAVAGQWLLAAQAFAGPPGPGRPSRRAREQIATGDTDPRSGRGPKLP